MVTNSPAKKNSTNPIPCRSAIRGGKRSEKNFRLSIGPDSSNGW